MNREELMAAEEAFLASLELPSVMDLSELPEHDSWDDWIHSVPLDGTDSDIDTVLGRLAEWEAEISRRENVVEYARALASRREHELKLQRSKEKLAQLPQQQAARHEQVVLGHLRWQELRSIDRLEPSQRKKASIFTFRCPHGCQLADVYVRQVDQASGPTPGLLLVASDARGQRVPAWLARDPAERPSPAHLAIGCRHGMGNFPTSFPSYVRRGARATRRVGDLGGVSWTPK